MDALNVALQRCTSYEPCAVSEAVKGVLSGSGWKVDVGVKILVKPNLLRAHSLTCTHPHVVAAACAWLLDHGAHVTVADSPGFGSVHGVAAAVGLADALRPLGLSVHSMRSPVPVRLPDGRTWGVARLALESDAILSIPKVKAHSQMRITLAVKNLFGCVCGLRKAVAHTVQGQERDGFADSLVALWAALPPVAALADGILAMHGTGPSAGRPYQLNCLGASSCAVALDTALYHVLGVEKSAVPLWEALSRRNVPQVERAALAFSGLQPESFEEGAGFRVPATLLDTSFRPTRLIWSLCRRLWSSWHV